MSRIEDLEKAVHQLYDEKNPERSDWTDWLADNHVFVVQITLPYLPNALVQIPN